MRDPFKNPFPETDVARHSIWDMLVTRDIDAFLTADWSKVADDFVKDGFLGINANRDANPDNWRLSFPRLTPIATNGCDRRRISDPAIG